MSDLRVTGDRTEVFDFGPVERDADAINLVLPGTKMWFTVKQALDDAQADALVEKTYVQGGTPDGIAIVTSVLNNTGTILLDAADLATLDASAIAYWDLLLEEPPNARRTTIDSGMFKIQPAVGTPA